MQFIQKQALVYVYVAYEDLIFSDFMKLYANSPENPSDFNLIAKKIDPVPSVFDTTSDPSVPADTDFVSYLYNPSINPSAYRIGPDSDPSAVPDDFPYKSWLYYYAYIISQPGIYSFAAQFCDEISNCGELSDSFSKDICLTPSIPQKLKNPEFNDTLNILSFDFEIIN